MNTELTVQEAALAWAHGKRVQCLHCNHCHEDDWKAVDGVGECEVGKISQVVFGLPAIYRFRLAPEPPAKKWRPWTPEEVPVGCVLVRLKLHPYDIGIIIASAVGGMLVSSYSGGISNISLSKALETLECSVDNKRTWLPCGVEVSE